VFDFICPVPRPAFVDAKHTLSLGSGRTLEGFVPPQPGSGRARSGESRASAGARAGSRGLAREEGNFRARFLPAMAFLTPLLPLSSSPPLHTNSRRGAVDEVSFTAGALLLFPGLPLRSPRVDLRPGGAAVSRGPARRSSSSSSSPARRCCCSWICRLFFPVQIYTTSSPPPADLSCICPLSG
jgi:hypothetical protein